MRVVLDTNILIAALISAGTPPDQIYVAWRKQRKFDLITSTWQLEEFSRVTRSKKLERYIKPREAGNLVSGLRRRAEVLERLPAVDFSSDPYDNPVIAMAMEGQANFLVTGDKGDLLLLKRIGPIRIVSAREFVGILSGRRSAQ